jgi:hypothetical protein
MGHPSSPDVQLHQLYPEGELEAARERLRSAAFDGQEQTVFANLGRTGQTASHC